MKKKTQTMNNFKEVFVIPQIPKVAGLKKEETYQTKAFASPLFGNKVKDDLAVGVSVSNTGDLDKQLEAFRTTPKLKEADIIEKYGKVHYEFESNISSKDQEALYGKPVTNEEVAPQPEPKPIYKEAQPFHDHVVHQALEINDDIPAWLKDPQAPSLDIIEEEPEITVTPIPVSQPAVAPGPKPVEKTVVKTVNSEHYVLPSIYTFKRTSRNKDDKPQWLLDNIDIINRTLSDHNIDGEVVNSIKGPTVTRYEIKLAPGVTARKVPNIEDTIKMNLAATSIRIEAPIPGKALVGIEVPNKVPELVAFGDVVNNPKFSESKDPLLIAVGEDIDGESVFLDINKMPHGLVAGATGSGKSVCVNTILVSLLLRNSPEDLRLILIDPKVVELRPYNDLPHLITPVITDARTASEALRWAVDEMEKRYRICADNRSRDIATYNNNVLAGHADGPKMPYIVIIIDELADLMMVAASDVEDSIKRITAKARAVGIHLLVATQRPTVDVVKGTIKANIPSRMAFRVASFVDSNTILDGVGAETLLGRGDMLIKTPEGTVRVQGAYIPDNEVFTVIDFITNQRPPQYVLKHQDFMERIEIKKNLEELDDRFEDIARWVVEEDSCSINAIQNEFKMGWNTAKKVVEQLENHSIIQMSEGTKASKVLVTPTELEIILAKIKGQS